jgi:hypothetical protein
MGSDIKSRVAAKHANACDFRRRHSVELLCLIVRSPTLSPTESFALVSVVIGAAAALVKIFAIDKHQQRD